MSEGKKPGKDFNLIENKSEWQRLLKEGAKTFASAMVWSKDQATIVNTHLKLYSEVDQTIYVQIPPELDLKKFIFELENAARECFFSVSLAYANIFFKARLKGIDKAGLMFHFPDQVFKIQRRSDLRFRIPEGHVLKVEFDDPLDPMTRISKKVYDLSAGGLAFITDVIDEQIYVKELLVRNITFTIQTRKIAVDAEVRHRKPIESAQAGKTAIKVGVIFKNLKASDAQVLAAYVFEESRRFFLRFS